MSVTFGTDSAPHLFPLIDVLGLEYPACVSLVGGGGKTSTMLSLARSVGASGKKVLITTSTKIMPPDGLPLVLEPSGESRLHDMSTLFHCHQLVASGSGIGNDGKLHGLASDRICELLGEGQIDAILCEADGSAGRPLKVHADYEPVVPACSTLLLVLGGLDAVGQVADAEVVHRAHLMKAKLGVREGGLVTPEKAARILHRAGSYAPAGSRTIFVLNKLDTSSLQIARDVCEWLRVLNPCAVVVAVSRGRATGL